MNLFVLHWRISRDFYANIMVICVSTYSQRVRLGSKCSQRTTWIHSEKGETWKCIWNSKLPTGTIGFLLGQRNKKVVKRRIWMLETMLWWPKKGNLFPPSPFPKPRCLWCLNLLRYCEENVSLASLERGCICSSKVRAEVFWAVSEGWVSEGGCMEWRNDQRKGEKEGRK